MIRIDAGGSMLTEGISELALQELKAVNEENYPKPWEVILYPEHMQLMARLKQLVFLPTDSQVKHNYPRVQFHGMTVIQDLNFSKDMIEMRDARGKSLAVIVNLSLPSYG